MMGTFDLWRQPESNWIWPYGEDILKKFFVRLRSRLPVDCLGATSHFGDAGFIRLFVHEVLADTDVELLVFADAGDFVFLDDPAKILKHRLLFNESHMAAGPAGEGLPLQLFDLPRMRKGNWSDFVVNRANDLWFKGGNGTGWKSTCRLGEGYLMKSMSEAGTVRG